jgi:hypothetical protein
VPSSSPSRLSFCRRPLPVPTLERTQWTVIIRPCLFHINNFE